MHGMPASINVTFSRASATPLHEPASFSDHPIKAAIMGASDLNNDRALMYDSFCQL